ncbi:TPA: hypothetical protein U1C15_001396 [Streptococcus suis]|nr:hypothetical protein [Streptococcus suis]
MNIEETISVFKECIKEFEIVQEEYLSQFGKNSLDYVIFWDPLHIEQHPDEVKEATVMIRKAISENVPLDNNEYDIENNIY